MTQAPTPLPESATAACRRCSAALAADQRYCLSCGARVASPRVDYLDVLAGGAGAAPAAASPRRPGRSFAHQLERVGGPMGAAAVVLVALGVGFLLGQGSGSTPAPQVVRPIVNVTNRGGGTTPASDTTNAGNGSGGAKHGKKGSGGAGTKGIAPVTQSKTGGDITKLQQQPDQQATGGKPPPKDNKASGGGSPTATIG